MWEQKWKDSIVEGVKCVGTEIEGLRSGGSNVCGYRNGRIGTPWPIGNE